MYYLLISDAGCKSNHETSPLVISLYIGCNSISTHPRHSLLNKLLASHTVNCKQRLLSSIGVKS